MVFWTHKEMLYEYETGLPFVRVEQWQREKKSNMLSSSLCRWGQQERDAKLA